MLRLRFTTQRFPEPHWPRGGILADEMGLGKTVEVLALVMSHKWPGARSQEPTTTTQLPPTSDANTGMTNQIEAMDATTSLGDSKNGVATPSLERRDVAQNPERVRENGTSLAVSLASDEVQCLCGAMQEDQLGREFVQCERCLVWQHSSCVRFNSTNNSSFICVRCLLKKVS